MGMRVGHIELPVEDPVASGRFYVDVLGFELVANQGDTFVWVRAGDVELLLRPGPPRPAGARPEVTGITLYSDDLPADVERLRAARIELALEGPCYHFQDPDGHWMQLVDPADHT
jgi:catechol 2,3-dioxygenase